MDMSKPTEEVIEFSHKAETDQDVLYRAYASKPDEWHRNMTKKVLRKVDIHLLPLLVVMYLLNFLDRKYFSLSLFHTSMLQS